MSIHTVFTSGSETAQHYVCNYKWTWDSTELNYLQVVSWWRNNITLFTCGHAEANATTVFTYDIARECHNFICTWLSGRKNVITVLNCGIAVEKSHSSIHMWHSAREKSYFYLHVA